MRVCKHGCDVLDLHVSLKNIFKGNRVLFPCLQSLILTLVRMEEFSKVMQVLDGVLSLHNCLGYVNKEKIALFLIKYILYHTDT